MYLKRAFVENTGPLASVDLELPFADDGSPKPVILVGGNGSGKTNFLSIIADGLFEGASKHFIDIVATGVPGNRPWFRIVGPATISVGATGSCALLEFQEDDARYVFKEKGGTLAVADVLNKIPDQLKQYAAWPDEGPVKDIGMNEDVAKKIFEAGAYLYFPSSRSEQPHWLNRESVDDEDFDFSQKFSNRLGKPIFVQRGIHQLKQWLASLLIDARMDVEVVQQNGVLIPIGIGNLQQALGQKAKWALMNSVLQTILDNPAARFVWATRHAGGRAIGFQVGDQGALPLDALSAGQATLLNVFGTIVRYGDLPSASDVKGICVIDEIDAHMHVDLQYRALPRLIAMFPKLQFLVSSHSPLFVLGMEKALGDERVSIVEMPSATFINAEAYSEFGRALDVLKQTKAFNQALIDSVGDPENKKLLVLLEGETDPVFFKTATDLLGRDGIAKNVEFEWVGAKDPKSGQGYWTGKDALNDTAKFLSAKPGLVKRPILLLYDNDANKAGENNSLLYIRGIPKNHGNSTIEAGIENLLPSTVITDDMFDIKENKKANGTKTTVASLNKMRLCNYLCNEKRDKQDFMLFGEVLDMVEEVFNNSVAALNGQ